MKCAVIFFHKDIESIYKRRWVEKCIKSILNQTYKDFDIFEIDYSGKSNQRIKSSKFFSVEMQNHIQAMNFIIDRGFSMGYDVIFNTNMDDFYDPRRFEKQLSKINEGCDLVSSNFFYIIENVSHDEIINRMNMYSYDIDKELTNNHNVIAHPCVCMSRSIYDAGFRYNENTIGYEDLELWKRIKGTMQIGIVPEYLLYYRIHSNQITKNHPGII